jgi:ribosomal protein S17E
MFRRKTPKEEWHVRAYKAGVQIYNLSEDLAASIIGYAVRNKEIVTPIHYENIPPFCAALLFDVLGMLAYAALDNKKRRGREAFLGKALDGFIATHHAHYAQITDEEASEKRTKVLSNMIEQYSKEIGQNFNTEKINSSMLRITHEYCEVFANLLIEKFDLSIETGKFSVNKASKAVSEIHASSHSMF